LGIKCHVDVSTADFDRIAWPAQALPRLKRMLPKRMLLTFGKKDLNAPDKGRHDGEAMIPITLART